MRLPMFLVGGAIVLGAALTSPVVESSTAARADEMGMTACPAFTSAKWVSPLAGPQPSGNRYTVTITGSAMSCAEATSWAKKLIPSHIAGKPNMPDYPPLRGGPSGYVCKGSPDSTGHAWRGNCWKKGTGAFQAGFTWTND